MIAQARNALFDGAPDECYATDGVGCCTATVLTYHQEDRGCTLGDLKPSVCLAHYCHGALLQTDFLSSRVSGLLQVILNPPSIEDRVDPSANEPIIDAFLSQVRE